MEHRIVKLAIVGCKFTTKLNVKKAIERYPGNMEIRIRYYADPEVAKTWLVSDEQ